jgi:hypothetical protein
MHGLWGRSSRRGLFLRRVPQLGSVVLGCLAEQVRYELALKGSADLVLVTLPLAVDILCRVILRVYLQEFLKFIWLISLILDVEELFLPLECHMIECDFLRGW